MSASRGRGTIQQVFEIAGCVLVSSSVGIIRFARNYKSFQIFDFRFQIEGGQFRELGHPPWTFAGEAYLKVCSGPMKYAVAGTWPCSFR